MPEAPTVPNMVAQSMGRILRDSTHTKYTVKNTEKHRQSNTTITWQFVRQPQKKFFKTAK